MKKIGRYEKNRKTNADKTSDSKVERLISTLKQKRKAEAEALNFTSPEQDIDLKSSGAR